jgi:hypothetical protein
MPGGCGGRAPHRRWDGVTPGGGDEEAGDLHKSGPRGGTDYSAGATTKG